MMTHHQHQKMAPHDLAVERRRFFTCTSQNQPLLGLQEWGAPLLYRKPRRDIMVLVLISICQCLPLPLLHPPQTGAELVWDASLASVCGDFRRRSVVRSKMICVKLPLTLKYSPFTVWVYVVCASTFRFCPAWGVAIINLLHNLVFLIGTSVSFIEMKVQCP